VWALALAAVVPAVLAAPAGADQIRVGLGAWSPQVRDDVVAPLRYQGTGARLQLGYAHSGERARHEVEFGFSGTPLRDRYGNGALALGFGAGYEYLHLLSRSPGTGDWLLGGRLRWDMAIQWYAQWDEEHLYWLTTYDLGPAVVHDLRLAHGHRLTTQLTLPLVALLSRPPAHRFYKTDDLGDVGYWFTKSHEHAGFASLPAYAAVSLRVAHRFTVSRHWRFETAYEIEYRRASDPRPIQLLVQSLTDTVIYAW
jgi:hypothetical protein